MRMRTLLVAAAITGVAASPNPFQPEAAAAATVSGVVMTAQPAPIASPYRHSAFPGAALRPDGTLVMVWRGGTDHVTSRDGVIVRAESHDLGRTWTAPQAILSGRDYRDPYLSYVDGHELLTFFIGTTGNPAAGAYVSVDQAPPVRVDNDLPYAAISGPVVKLPDGRWGTAYYGRRPGETVDTAWIAWSHDLGQTWTSNRIINATGAGIPTAEPWLVVDGVTVRMLSRWGSGQIAIRSATGPVDVASSWGPVTIAVSGCNGRPATVVTSAGTVVMVCRDTRGGTWGGAQVAYSLDHTASWRWGPTLMSSQGGIGMTYGAPVDVGRGVIVTPFGMERGDGSSTLHVTNVAEMVTGPHVPVRVPR